MRRVIGAVVGAAVLTVSGCATPSRETIQVAYGDKLAALEPGTPLEDFKRLFPKAKEFQRTFTALGTISVYRLEHLYKQEDDIPATVQSLYFRFVNDRLDRWGYSSTWGANR